MEPRQGRTAVYMQIPESQWPSVGVVRVISLTSAGCGCGPCGASSHQSSDWIAVRSITARTTRGRGVFACKKVSVNFNAGEEAEAEKVVHTSTCCTSAVPNPGSRNPGPALPCF